MTAGINAGNQLNLLLFEVVGITRDPETGFQQVFSVAVHPLVRVPSMISYASSSRTAATQTIGGSQVTRAPRGFDSVQLAGAWGVESVGLLAYIGTGEVRAQRFQNEVVDLSDAISKDDVNACINALTGTPFLKALLTRYFARPDDTSFAINFYDLWEQRRFQAKISSYRTTRSHRNGGATGLKAYQMQVDEVGPTVTGAPGTALLLALFDGLTTWSNLNQAILSYNVQTLINSALAVPDLLLGQLSETQAAVVSQIDAVTGLLGGFSSSSNENLNAFLSNAKALQDVGNQIIAAIEAARTPSIDAPRGGINWGTPPPDLPSADAIETALASDLFENEFLNAFDQADLLDQLEDLSEAAAFQLVAGKFFGFSPEEYQALLSGVAQGKRSRIQGSIPYTVTDIDSESTLEDRFGVPFDRILAWNESTPDELLLSGRSISIPVASAAAGARRIDGLPVFGSQLGQEAWGRVLRADLLTDDDGQFLILSGTDALQQGSDWLIEEAQDDLLLFANVLPEGSRGSALTAKIQDLLLSDKRIASVDDVTITTGAGALAIATQTTAINSASATGGS